MDDANGEDAAWGSPSGSSPRWPASLAVVASIALYLVLPRRLIDFLGPRWLIPSLEGILVLALSIASPRHLPKEVPSLRVAAIVLIAIVNLANVVSLGELLHALLYGTKVGGRVFIYASVPIWVTNVLVFALWYWELDRGGPAARLGMQHRKPDFLFPQMSNPGVTEAGWSPTFFDYVYTSFTNATAFSPTDTMPLTRWAKSLMMLQSFASLLTVALVVSRAVNILQ